MIIRTRALSLIEPLDEDFAARIVHQVMTGITPTGISAPSGS